MGQLVRIALVTHVPWATHAPLQVCRNLQPALTASLEIDYQTVMLAHGMSQCYSTGMPLPSSAVQTEYSRNSMSLAC